MTTYIKRTALLPVNTYKEYDEAIEEELLYLEDIIDTIQDITVTIDDKDKEANVYEEVRDLRRVIQDINDVQYNMRKLIEDYTAKLTEAIPGPR